MNERIKEFAKQAKEYADTKYSKLVSTSRWGDSVPGIRELYTEKLAELIVRECMDIVSNQTTLDTNEDFREGFNHGIKYAWTDIRKHFGVEE
jgi:capsid protein